MEATYGEMDWLNRRFYCCFCGREGVRDITPHEISSYTIDFFASVLFCFVLFCFAWVAWIAWMEA